MNDYDPTSPHGTSATSGLSVAGSSGGAVRRSLSNTRSKWIGAAALMCAVIGLSAGWATSPAAAASSSAATSPSPAASPPATGGARSGPAPGGVWGTVGSVSTSSFIVSTLGQKVTVDEESYTRYRKGERPASARAITTGEPVLVLGTVSTTITATQVILHPTGGTTPSAAGVIPFQQGAPAVSKTVGQIPANYTEGSGTIVTGRTANKATEASLRAYPGGVVDRVVKLSNGEYEVHNIGVAWPHHVFVKKNFKVVGAF
jgi:hypothetical protein